MKPVDPASDCGRLKLVMHEKASVQVECLIIKEGDLFVAYSPALNLATQGNTYEEACKAFQEALDLFVEEVMESGTLKEVLEECGWKKVEESWIPPRVVGQNTHRVTIPT